MLFLYLTNILVLTLKVLISEHSPRHRVAGSLTVTVA